MLDKSVFYDILVNNYKKTVMAKVIGAVYPERGCHRLGASL